MCARGVSFSIAAHAAWAPGVTSSEAWAGWARAPFQIAGQAEPAVASMPAMLRRRAGFLGKMALEVAYACIGDRTNVPAVFCSRHGEVARAVDMLGELADKQPLSPTAFGLAVHNASAGLFSIARTDRSNHIALAAGAATIEHAVIEACGLLADSEEAVLLVAYDCALPPLLAQFSECDEQPHAWAWLVTSVGEDPIRLSWRANDGQPMASATPGGLEVLRFQLSGAARLERVTGPQHWTWSRDA
jgi:hypothetical protein